MKDVKAASAGALVFNASYERSGNLSTQRNGEEMSESERALIPLCSLRSTY